MIMDIYVNNCYPLFKNGEEYVNNCFFINMNGELYVMNCILHRDFHATMFPDRDFRGGHTVEGRDLIFCT